MGPTFTGMFLSLVPAYLTKQTKMVCIQLAFVFALQINSFWSEWFCFSNLLLVIVASVEAVKWWVCWNDMNAYRFQFAYRQVSNIRRTLVAN